MTKGVAMVVDRNIIDPKPSHWFSNIFNRFSDVGYDYITVLCVA